jgi:dihydropteroate synthase
LKAKNKLRWRIDSKIVEVSAPCVMGILNATPDSFYPGSRINSVDSATQMAEKMIAEGASILDVGGQSTRPGAELISESEECKRVVPVIAQIRKQHPDILISVDTFYAEVAKQALDAGASIINDISAGEADDKMFEVVAAYKVPYMLMHKKGMPQTMQQNPQYQDVVHEVLQYLAHRIRLANEAGIMDIVIDPGFGFGKTLEHNYTLLKKLNLFSMLDCPILVGVSRKSMIWKPLGIHAETSLSATQAVHMAALLNGADILRVHDVKEAVETIRLYGLIS